MTITPSLEDYIEALGQLSANMEEVRLTDIALRLGLSKASVSRAMSTLRQAGYVEQRRYGTLRLTETGRVISTEVEKRHNLLERFLREVLGVDPAVAAADACRMEHAISRETMEKWVGFMDNFELSSAGASQTEDGK